MTSFVAPASVTAPTACLSTAATITPAIPCRLEAGHTGLHRSGSLTWHDPVRVLVGGRLADLTSNSEHWIDGDVYLSTDEPL